MLKQELESTYTKWNIVEIEELEFIWPSNKEFVEKITRYLRWEISVYELLEYYDVNSIISYLLETDKVKPIAPILLKTEWDLSEHVAKKLISNNQIRQVWYNIKRFNSLWKNIALAIIKNWETYIIFHHPEKFYWLDNEVASLLIDNWFLLSTAKIIQVFANLSYKTMIKFLKAWFWDIVKENFDKFNLSPEERIKANAILIKKELLGTL